LARKATVHKTKFKNDKKNQLDDLARKRKAKEDKRMVLHSIGKLLPLLHSSWWRHLSGLQLI
jgi:hypothetical protein